MEEYVQTEFDQAITMSERYLIQRFCDYLVTHLQGDNPPQDFLLASAYDISS